ncbi:hypothetical protein LAV88_25735, partial [Rhizobium sp. VS19-DR104.1]|uniref:hypothetical protein n=1 Tax=Rhizobium sp. VS19-DR104.1 TaxID=2875953 RepID=UPI001CD00363
TPSGILLHAVPLTCLRAGKSGPGNPSNVYSEVTKNRHGRLGTEYPHFSTTVHNCRVNIMIWS